MAGARLEVLLSADGRQLANAMQKAEKDVQGLENELKELPKVFDQVDKSLAKTTSQLKSAAQATQPLTKGIQLSDKALAKLPSNSNKATESLVNLGRVAQDAPFGFLGIANNINPLVESFQRLKKETGSTKGALKSLVSGLGGAGGLGLAISLVSSLLVVFGDRLFKTSKTVEDAEDANKKYKESVEGIFQNAGKEAAEVLSLIAVLKSETETRQRKLAAIKELQSIQPEVFANLKLEGSAVAGLDAAYQAYIKNLRTVISVKIKQAQLEALITKQLQKQGGELTKSQKKLFDPQRAKEFTDSIATAFVSPDDPLAKSFQKRAQIIKKEDDKIEADIKGLFDEITELSKGVDLKIDTKKPGKEVDKFYNDLIKRAKAFESFINNATIRFANFEIDPTESRDETIKKAQEFIRKATEQRELFELKPLIIIDGINLKPTTKYFDDLKKNADKILKDLQKEISDLTARNPVLIEAERVKAEENDRNRQFNDALGIPQSFKERFPLLNDMQIQAAIAADKINGLLTPAFDGLFNAIKAGENPLKAFFQSLGQAVQNLIQQLIQAALQAAILSALSGGKSSFGDLFGRIAGFRAEGGPVFANRPYVVGERGPELFIPQGGGRIIPNNEMNSGIAGITQGSINITGQIVADGKNLRLIFARQGRYNDRNV